MFGFDWSEIALIGVVALVLIGPKDMPVAIRTIAGFVKKARKMAADFQGQVDEMVRDTELHEVRNSLTELRSDLRGLNLRGQLAKVIDADGSIRRTMSDDPLKTPPPFPPPREVEARPETAIASDGSADDAPAPAFLPPGTAQPAAEAGIAPPTLAVIPPAFIPPADGHASAEETAPIAKREPVPGTVPSGR